MLISACFLGQTNDSVQVNNAEPEHDYVESEKRYTEEARGIIFARRRHNIDASPQFSQNLVTILFS